MSILALKTSSSARAVAMPMIDMSVMTRATALAIGAVAAGSVFSAGWVVADLVLKAL